MKSADEIPSQFFSVATNLMQDMTPQFTNEAIRVDCFKSIIANLGDSFKYLSITRAGYRSDGVVLDNIGNFLVNWEFKNELFGNSTCPH